MPDRLFQREEFGTSARSSATLFFICPYDTLIRQVRFAIRRLRWAGFHVVAYETTTAVFTAADPAILPELISQVRDDIKARIARLKTEGVSEFGFFGSSLGSFILYNCVGSKVPEFRWGVFNTGGNIAAGIWNMGSLRELHVARGWSLPRLEEAWAEVQWPDFGELDGCRFVFSSSRRDTIAPLRDIPHYLDPMLRAGAEVSLYEMPATSHRTTVIAGLVLAPRLIRRVRRPRRRNWRSRRLGPVVRGGVPGREDLRGKRAAAAAHARGGRGHRAPPLLRPPAARRVPAHLVRPGATPGPRRAARVGRAPRHAGRGLGRGGVGTGRVGVSARGLRLAHGGILSPPGCVF
jgi:hypothetical protein